MGDRVLRLLDWLLGLFETTDSTGNCVQRSVAVPRTSCTEVSASVAPARFSSRLTFAGDGSAMMVTATTTQHSDLQQPGRPEQTARGHIGLIVAGSMAAGLVLAVVLVALPFIPGRENVLTGVVLLAFALGWALLAALSVRLTDRPQRWAAAPAAFMAVAGLISLLPPGS